MRTLLARCLLSSANSGAPPAKHWTQDELAAHIGTVRDVVGRTPRTFSREGLIRHEQELNRVRWMADHLSWEIAQWVVGFVYLGA